MGCRGQVGIEFLLVLSFMLALTAVLLGSAEAHFRAAESLDKAALCKAALDSTASLINHAFLSGRGTRVSSELFIPDGSVCFIVNSSFSPPVLQCDADALLSRRVESRGLRTAAVSFSAACPVSGWLRVTAVNNGNSVSVTCAKLN